MAKQARIKNTVKVVFLRHLLKSWIPEFSYLGEGNIVVVRDFQSALRMVLKMHPNLAQKCEVNRGAFRKTCNTIRQAIKNARSSFYQRKRNLLAFAKAVGRDEEWVKKLVVSGVIDFFTF